jgi:hypothetical protein
LSRRKPAPKPAVPRGRRKAHRSLSVALVRWFLLVQVWVATLTLRRILLLAALPLAALLVLAGPRLLEMVPTRGEECAAGAEGLGFRAIIGSDGCVLAGMPVAAPDVTLTQDSDTALSFPQEVVDVPPPPPEPAIEANAPAVQAAQPRSGGASRSGAAPAAAPANQGPPPPEIAVQLFRQLGLPLPNLQPNGTFESDGSMAEPRVNQSTGGAGAPSTVVIDGTINGTDVSSVPQAAPAPPAAPPPGQGGVGNTASGSPGLPPD